MSFSDEDFGRYLLEARENAKLLPSRQLAGTLPRRYPESEPFVPVVRFGTLAYRIGNFPARTFTNGWKDRFKSKLAIAIHRAINSEGDQ